MRKLMGLFVVMLVIAATLSVIAMAASGNLLGQAPNAGDGISDGSGMDPHIQNGDPLVDSPGPAPNSGDGIPDGSGF